MPGVPLKINEEHPHSLYEGIEYREFWTGWQKHKLDELEHAVVRDLLMVPGSRIIDVGCGYGRLADCYLDRFEQVVMFDGSMSLLHQALEQTRGRAICIAGDVMHLPFRAASFDTVLMVRVFHHIVDSQACLAELQRILCNHGTFIFGYRNKRSVVRTLKWLIGKNSENPFTYQPDGMGSILIRHHPGVVHQMLLESGFESIRYYGAGVVDWFAGRLGALGRWMPSGRRVAGLLGRTKIAPWILCGATAGGNSDLIHTDQIDDLLQCPVCGGSVFSHQHGYRCLKCTKHYPMSEGIIDMRI